MEYFFRSVSVAACEDKLRSKVWRGVEEGKVGRGGLRRSGLGFRCWYETVCLLVVYCPFWLFAFPFMIQRLLLFTVVGGGVSELALCSRGRPTFNGVV